MTTRSEALALLAKCLTSILGKPFHEGTLDARAELADLGIDSARSLELVGALEEELASEFPNDRIERVRTVGDLLELIVGSPVR